jgi:hypothetical protein
VITTPADHYGLISGAGLQPLATFAVIALIAPSPPRSLEMMCHMAQLAQRGMLPGAPKQQVCRPQLHTDGISQLLQHRFPQACCSSTNRLSSLAAWSGPLDSEVRQESHWKNNYVLPLQTGRVAGGT